MVTRRHSLSLVASLVFIPYHSLSVFVIPCHSLPLVAIRCHSLYHSLSLVVPFVVIRCHSLSFVLTCCYSLYHSLSFVVTRCHSLSFVVTRCHSLYHSLSLDIPLACLFINDQYCLFKERISTKWNSQGVAKVVKVVKSSKTVDIN